MKRVEKRKGKNQKDGEGKGEKKEEILYQLKEQELKSQEGRINTSRVM